MVWGPMIAWYLFLAGASAGAFLTSTFVEAKYPESVKMRVAGRIIAPIFVGIGLFIFLWAITGEFGLGCIGLLVMFTGFGQLVIFYSQQKKNEEK